MFRGMRDKLGRDEGMTILEVVIAASILFIVLTGILGVVSRSTMMGMQSKHITLLNNAVNSYIERVQAMPFEKVVVGGGTGELLATETTMVAGYQITFTPSVTVMGGTGLLKKLTLSATITSPNGTNESFITDVVIRDKAKFMTAAEAGGPEVIWDVVTMPAAGSVVWGNSVQLRATAEAIEGLTIASAKITADNSWKLEDLSNLEANWEWAPVDRQPTWTMSFFWDTLQEGVIDSDTLEEAAVMADGLRTLTLQVIDSDAGKTERTFTLILDNYKPGKPSSVPIATIKNPTETSLAWGAASDGSDTAWGSRVTLSAQGSTGTWGTATVEDIEDVTRSVATNSFSRYWVGVRGRGLPPRELVSDEAVATSWVTPPLATGSSKAVVGSKSGGKYPCTTTVTLGAEEPKFPCTGQTYTWYRSTSATGPWTTAVGAGRTRTDTFVEQLSKTTDPLTLRYYYRCKASLQPGTDYEGQAVPAVTVWSTVIGPTPTTVQSGYVLPSQWLP